MGQTAELTHEVTEKDIRAFYELTGDDNPLHMDENYAAKTRFKKRVAHGILTASFLSTVVGTQLPGKGSLWLSQTIRFILPVRVGDIIKVIVRVRHKSPALRVVVLDTEILNQNGQKVLEGEAKVQVLPEVKEEVSMNNISKGAAIITGASRGIGAATALRLAEDRLKVIINYHTSQEEAQTVLNRILEMGKQGCIFQADVRNYDEVERMIQYAREECSTIDVLVNNASSKIISQDFQETTWEDIQSHIDTQVKGMFNTCKAVIPIMEAQKRGKIINIGTIFTDNVPPAKLYGYVLAKSAVVALTRCLAAEFGPKGININCVAPGMTETTLIADLPESVKRVTSLRTPLRRLAKPEDIANVISFLASDAADYMTGETIRVCGGQVMI